MSTPQPRLTREQIEEIIEEAKEIPDADDCGFIASFVYRLASEALALMDERDQLAHHGRNASASLEITLKENERLEAERDAYRIALEQLRDDTYKQAGGLRLMARAALSTASEVGNEH